MTPRETEISAFVQKAGWADARCEFLAGDASARRYQRLRLDDRAAILMDAPSGPETLRFVQVQDWLLAQGFSAPRNIAADPAQGLLLLEDLGDALFAKLIEADRSAEFWLYPEITDFLFALHAQPAPDFVAPLDGAGLAALTDLTADWYPCADTEAASRIGTEITRLYNTLNKEKPVMCLRDFHAENVIWLPEREGVARLGLLDFQDAVAAHPAYDLVSALQDARRDVSPEIEIQERARYTRMAGLDPVRFDAIYALLGTQRSLRILGIFARLCLAMGKAHYVDFIPRSWGYIQRNLEHPELQTLAQLISAAYPAPTDARLQDLKDRCGQIPIPS